MSFQFLVKTLLRLLTVLLILFCLQSWLLDIRQVKGRSMEPTLPPGRTVICWKWAYGLPTPLGSGYLLVWNPPRPGDMVVFLAPEEDHYNVKKIAGVSPDEVHGSGFLLWVLGDNPAFSRDSRDYGPVSIEAVLGKVIF